MKEFRGECTINGVITFMGVLAWGLQLAAAASQQALQIQSSRATHDLSSDGSAVWLHFQARCEEAPSANPTVTDANTSLAFFVNTNLNLVVYSNTVPVELSTRIQTNVWIRFDVYCDYDDMYWDLSMDGINVAAGNGLTWTPVESRLYTVYWTPSLTNAFALLQGDIPYPQSEFIDSGHSEEAAGFYRLKVQVQ